MKQNLWLANNILVSISLITKIELSDEENNEETEKASK